MVWVVLALMRMGRKVIQLRLENVANIMKRIKNCPLKCGSSIFEAEREILVHEHSHGQIKVIFSWLVGAILIWL